MMETVILVIGVVIGYSIRTIKDKMYSDKKAIEKINQVKNGDSGPFLNVSIDDICQSLVLAINSIAYDDGRGPWYKKEDLFRIRRECENVYPGSEIRYQFLPNHQVKVNVSYKNQTQSIMAKRVF